MAFSFQQLKDFARQVFKVKPGGPVDVTRGVNVIDYHDKLIEKMQEVATGGGATFPANEPPTATAFGNLPAGTALASRSVLEVVRQAGSATETFPGYAAPFATLGSTQSGDVERGTTITPTLTPSFSQGDAGSLTAYELKFGATVLASDAAAPITYGPLSDTYKIGQESVSYTAVFSYAQGPLKTGDQGSPAPGRINAGQVQASVSLRGLPRLFYGSTASASASSAAVRALPGQPLVSGGGQFILNTGTDHNIFEIHLPPGRNLVSVIDLDALNKDITAEYLASTTNVDDAGGTAVSYTTRRKTQAVAYTTGNHRHQVTYS
jgi:hypothetical protein